MASSPLLRDAGRQYLARQGEVPREVLRFLPHEVDDLNAREALLVAGTVLVDEFRDHVLQGRGIEYAEGLVPPAFEQAVTERLALDLFAAAVALLARLSDGRPAGCVAEEILAVGLIEGAKHSWRFGPTAANSRRLKPLPPPQQPPAAYLSCLKTTMFSTYLT